jgi:hypothetical protein
MRTPLGSASGELIILNRLNIFPGLKMLTELTPDKRWDAAKYLSELASRYITKARSTTPYSSKHEYEEINQMASQLAMLLPTRLYTELAFAISAPDDLINIATFTINLRKYVMGEEEAGDLNASNLISHAPNAGFIQRKIESRAYGESGHAGS